MQQLIQNRESTPKMTRGLIALLCAYILSQFYRAFLPVLAPVLAVAIGARAADLAPASGPWVLVFPALPIPLGPALRPT